MRSKRRDKRVEFTDGTTAIMRQNCTSCGKVVDLSLRIFTMETFQKVYCWNCFEKKCRRM